jgi:3-oxoacyl-[acyl-carrier protein] reductase
MIDIKGKNALVTGSSRGIGQQIVQGLAKLGCNVIVHGRTKESCIKTLDLIKNYNVKTYCVYGELSNESQVEHLIKQVKDFNIPIDILYNNAAVMTPYHTDFWNHTWEDWMESFKVNVMAIYSLCRAFIPPMMENGFGRVINVTSGIKGEPELAPYGASKWAVNKLTDDLSVKVQNTAVRINTLDPSWLRTDLGGEYAHNPVEAVMPGALEPILIDNDGPNGQEFFALNHNLKIKL